MFYANDHRSGTTISMALPTYFIFLLMFLLLAPQISAHGTYPLSRGPRIKKIDAGLGGMYRDGNWVPIQISLENNGPEFDGKIALDFPSTLNNPGAAISSKTTYQQEISLPYALNDAYLLIGEDFAPLGTLAPRQTKPVSLVLNASLNSGVQLLLADRIAASRGLSIAALPNSSGLDTLHRHIYMLGSLSNDCGTGLCPDGTMVSGMQTTRQDPLLLSGASATLIGWVSSQATETNAVTIGGTTSPQIQEALIRAPLTINFSGTVTIPASLISSQIANIQATDGNLQGDN